MENKIKIFIIALIALSVIPSLVSAFGEVTGPVVIHVPIGGTGVGMWGLGHNETVNVKLGVEGNASKYISLPSEVTLSPNGIYWVNVTAIIPADYNISQGTNISGIMYAVLEGKPGQVKINLQLKKYVYIIVEQPQTSESVQSHNFITGLFALQPVPLGITSVAGLVIIVSGIFYFVKNKKEVNK
jgi:hypothetical protein